MPGQTVKAPRFSMSPGGKGANQAVAAAKLKARSLFLGCVGGDRFGAELRKSLEDHGVNTENLLTIDDEPSGMAAIHVDAKGENAIAVTPGANAYVTPKLIEKNDHLIDAADMVMLQLESPVEAVECAIKIAKKKNVPTILDPAPVPEEGVPVELLEATYLTPNQSELFALTGATVSGAHQTPPVFGALRDQGAQSIVAKLGADGASAIGLEGGAFGVPAFPVVPVDTTAAGDAFNSALAVALCRDKSLAEAVRFACAAGALAATKSGAHTAMPTLDEVEQLILVNS